MFRIVFERISGDHLPWSPLAGHMLEVLCVGVRLLREQFQLYVRSAHVRTSCVVRSLSSRCTAAYARVSGRAHTLKLPSMGLQHRHHFPFVPSQVGDVVGQVIDERP